MRWFEISDTVTEGCRLAQSANGPGIPMGVDVETGTPQYIALGQSLARALSHRADAQADFRLKWGGLARSSILCVVAQSRAEALADEGAVALLDCVYDEDLGTTHVENAWNRPAPALVHHVVSKGMTREVYLFRKGEGLYIRHPPSVTDVRFTLVWDGAQLIRSERKARRKRQEQQVPLELRA
jgi:hypothetical protein